MTSDVGTRRQARRQERGNDMTTEELANEALVDEETGVKVDRNTRVQFPVTIPLGLRIHLEKFCIENKVAAGDVARKAIADAFGYTGPLGGKVVRQGMSEEEKDARNKARSASRTAMIKAMGARYGVALGEGKKKKGE